MSVELNEVKSGYNLSAINDNFQELQAYINDMLLHRDGSIAGQAMMDRALDMNGNPILNIGVDLNNPLSLLTLLIADARYYNVTGDSLFGTMNANGNRITGLPKAVGTTDAVRKDQLDDESSSRQSADASLQAQLNGTTPPMASAFSPISWHRQVIENSLTIPDNVNAWSFGPDMTIADGQEVSVGTNSYWTIANGDVNE